MFLCFYEVLFCLFVTPSVLVIEWDQILLGVNEQTDVCMCVLYVCVRMHVCAMCIIKMEICLWFLFRYTLWLRNN